MAIKRKHPGNVAKPVVKRQVVTKLGSRAVQLKAERDRAFRLERANDVRSGKWLDMQSDPVSIVATVLVKTEQAQERRAKRKAKKQDQIQTFERADSRVLVHKAEFEFDVDTSPAHDEGVDSIEPGTDEDIEKPVAGAAYIELLKSLPTEEISKDTMTQLAKLGSRGSPYVGRTVSTSAGHKPGNSKASKRRTNGYTAQDVLLPAAASRSNQVPKSMDRMTVGDLIYILVNHLVWKDLEVDEFLSYSSDFLFLFIHALNRHSEKQGNVTIQIIDRRESVDKNDKPVPFWSALDLAKQLDIYNPDYVWDRYIEGDLHPRKFTHEYLSWGSLRHKNSTLLQANLADLIADGLYKLFPDFETPRGCGRVGLYQGQVRCRVIGYPSREGARNATSPYLASLYSYTDCDKEDPMTVELLMLVRKLALRFGTNSNVGGYRLAGVGQPHLFVFLNLLTFHKRPARDPVFLSWITTHYSIYDIEELYMHPCGTFYEGITNVAENLPGVMQYLDLLRDCINVFDLKILPDNVLERVCDGRDFRDEDDRLNQSTELFWSIEEDQQKRERKKAKKSNNAERELDMVVIDVDAERVEDVINVQAEQGKDAIDDDSDDDSGVLSGWD